MAHLLGAENISLSYPTKHVLQGVTLGVNEGDRIGIVGRNGDGKSTLMRILLGNQDPDSGQVTRRGGVKVAMLDQRDNLDPTLTVGQSIQGNRYDHEIFSDPKIRDVIYGLLTYVPWDSKVSNLSGGQRRRVALAKLLCGDWDVIGLDEPTNHLDLEGVRWLAGHLKERWSRSCGGLLVITHDRWFLDAVSDSTWEVHDQIVEPFEGGYAAYTLARLERDRRADLAQEKRQNLLRKELAWLRRGAPARTSKPKFRVDAANALIADVPAMRNSIELTRMAVARLGKKVVDLIDVSAGYSRGTTQEKLVLQAVNWRIAPGERSGILGTNGAGKSTLLSLISGDLKPWEGQVNRGKTVQMAFLDQEFSQLKTLGDQRVREVLSRFKTTLQVGDKELTPAQLLERLGFDRAHLHSFVNELSGGQKRRLQLLLILLEEPNVLILDEPTNDVDTDMLTAMEDLLDSWPGTLLIVSHDRYLLERVTDTQYAIIGGTVRHLPGGVDEYLRLRQAEIDAENSKFLYGSIEDVKSSNEGSLNNETAHNDLDMENGQKTFVKEKLDAATWRSTQKAANALERKLENLQNQKTTLLETMAKVDGSDYEKLSILGQEMEDLNETIEKIEMQWIDIAQDL